GVAVRCSVRPLLQSCPKFAGWSGSPRTPVIRPSACSITTPQPTPQYGHVERVSTSAECQVHDAALDLHGKAARAAGVGSDCLASRELDRPVVQGTGDAIAEDDPLRQRSAFVRTT